MQLLQDGYPVRNVIRRALLAKHVSLERFPQREISTTKSGSGSRHIKKWKRKEEKSLHTVKGSMNQAFYPSLVPMRMARAEREKASSLSP